MLKRFALWEAEGRQDAKELDWMKRHALRTLIKQGHAGAMAALGYTADVPVAAQITLADDVVAIGGALAFEVTLASDAPVAVLVDYRIGFARPSGKMAEKVFKLKVATVKAGVPLVLKKSHKLKGGASTFTLYAGAHDITVQVNGRDVARASFTLTDHASSQF